MRKFEQGNFKLAVIVDAQEDFVLSTGALPVPGAEALIPDMEEYLKNITLENGYVGALFTADTHNEKDYPESKEAKGDPDAVEPIPGFPPHCMQGTDGFKFAINPANVAMDNNVGRFILNKGVFNMWEEDNIVVRPLVLDGEPVSYGGAQDRNEFFETLKSNGIEDVEIVGFAADYCVMWAIAGFVARGFNVTLYDNLTAGIAKDIHAVVETEFSKENVQVL